MLISNTLNIMNTFFFIFLLNPFILQIQVLLSFSYLNQQKRENILFNIAKFSDNVVFSSFINTLYKYDHTGVSL